MMRTSILLCFALAACSDGMQVGSVHVKSGTIGAGGGSLVITESDHPQLAGTRIIIPPAALAEDTLVGIGISDAAITLDEAKPHGPALYIAPISLVLHAPATVTMPFDDGRAGDLLVRTLAGGTTTDVSHRITAIDEVALLVTFELDMLAHVQPQAVYNLLPDGPPCNSPQCAPDAGTSTDAGCALGACPQDAGAPIDAPNASCGLLGCPVGTSCTPAGGCVAFCNNQICPQGQGCNANDECVAQCGMGGAITFLCPPGEVCDFGTGTCHP